MELSSGLKKKEMGHAGFCPSTAKHGFIEMSRVSHWVCQALIYPGTARLKTDLLDEGLLEFSIGQGPVLISLGGGKVFSFLLYPESSWDEALKL